MANFNVQIDFENLFPDGITDENLAIDMVAAGQKVILEALRAEALNHVETGKMAKSLRARKPRRNKYDAITGQVKFTGTDRTKKSNNGNKFDCTNWIKAFRIEYGTSQQSAQPFVRPTVERCNSEVTRAMEAVFEEKGGG